MSENGNIPQPIVELIELASAAEANVDDMLNVLCAVEASQLKQHAFHILGSIRNFTQPINALKFAAVHHAIGSNSSVFAMMAHECIVGTMTDLDACEVIGSLYKRNWLKKFPGALFHACLHSKPKLATFLFAEGLRITNENWASFLSCANDNNIVMMAELYIAVAAPSREDLLAMRLAAKEGSPLVEFIDTRLGLRASPKINERRH